MKKLVLTVCLLLSFVYCSYAVPLAAGTYCIGPFASYTLPSGPAYINGVAPYVNITAALLDLNANGAAGHIIFELQNDYTSATELNPINLTYQGAPAATVTFKVRTDLLTQLVIGTPRGNSNEFGVLNFNGGDYISFDGTIGSNTCSQGIIVRNTGFFGKTISFENDAQHNTLRGLQVEIAPGGGGIFLEYIGGTSGNDYNTIECNVIKPRADAVTGNFGIETRASTNFNSKNDNIIINDNKFQNCMYGMYFNGNGNNGLWTITNNHFYRTTGFESVGNFIFMSTGDTATLKVAGNYFGGNAPFALGSKMLASTAGIVIDLAVSPASVNISMVNNNTIQNITSNGNLEAFRTNGPFNVMNNTVGNPNVTNDITATYGFYFLNYFTSHNGNEVSISGNTVTNVAMPVYNLYIPFSLITYSSTGGHVKNIVGNTFKNLNTAGHYFYGIQVVAGCCSGYGGNVSYNVFENISQTVSTGEAVAILKLTGEALNVVGNRIGHLTSSNNMVFENPVNQLIYVSSIGASRVDSNVVANINLNNAAAVSCRVIDYSSSSGPIRSVSNNILRNIVTKSTKSDIETNPGGAALCGIFTGGGASINFTNNSISGLRVVTTGSSSPGIAGMVITTNSGTTTISKNSIYDLTNTATNTSTYPYIMGIYHSTSGSTVRNNMIAINNGSNTNGIRIFGIRFYNGIDRSFYHNTIAISGTSSNSANSYAFYKDNASLANDQVRNNIFYNSRTGGTGKHYAIAHASGLAGEWGPTDYNNLYSSNASTLGEWPLGTDKTFAQWKTTSTKDINSKNTDVRFINVVSDLHLVSSTNCKMDSTAGTGVGVSDDIDGQVRSVSFPDIGADEFSYEPGWAVASSNSIICEPQNLTLSVTDNGFSPFTYSWSGPGGFSSPLQAPVILSPAASASGVYSVIVTDAYTCKSAPAPTTVTIHQPPAVTCPGNITVSNAPGACSALVSYLSAIATGVPAPVISYSQGSGTSFPVGTTTVNVSATNDCGTATCSFTVSVTDNENPVITNCPGNINLVNAPGACSAIASWIMPTAMDNCGIQSFTASHVSGSSFPVGTTAVSYTATDIHGKASICLFNVVVTDSEQPVIANCPSQITQCNPIVNWTPPTAIDNCAVASLNTNHNPGETFPVGTTIVNYTATDIHSNVQTCSFNVTILPTFTWYADTDNDGFGDATDTIHACSAPPAYVNNGSDCNDTDAGIHVPVQYYVDADGDGFGSVTTAMLCSVSAPAGYSTNNSDCNDGNAAIHVPVQYYIDADGDGFGSVTTAMLCSAIAPAGYSTTNTDCNDANAAIHVPVQYYVDADGDGFGSVTTAMLCATSAPAGYSSNNTDCNDANAAIHAPVLYYVDADGDGFGSVTTAMLCASAAPVGYATNNTDCNDANAAIHAPVQYYIDGDGDGFGSATTAMLCSSLAPSGYSVNSMDCNDANAAIHSPVLYYVDADGDGFGSATTALLCTTVAPVGYSANNTDCNDANIAIHSPVQYYIDADGDGFGSATTALLCLTSAPAGYSSNNTDCNDANAAIHAPVLYYVDADGDGFGSVTTAVLCASAAPVGYATNNTDCNDANAAIHAPVQYYVDGDGDGFGSVTPAMLCVPTAPPGYSVNNTDCNDANPAIHSPVLYYVDADGDGFGSATTSMLCATSAPAGYSSNSTDCNDNNAGIHSPVLYYVDADGDGFGSASAALLCAIAAPVGYSTNNTDCNDANAGMHVPVQYYVDADGDGFGSVTTAMLCTSVAPSGYSVNNTDCNDANAAIHSPVQYYVDTDHDGYGSVTTTTLCSSGAPVGYSAIGGDCNDNNANIHPGAVEICNGIDDDCNTIIDDGATLPAANAGPNQNVCAATVTLAANSASPGTGTWSVLFGTLGGSFSNIHSPVSVFTGTAGLTYTLRWTVTTGICTAQDDVAIAFGQFVNPTITIAASQISICPGITVNFTAAIANGGTTPVYQWKKNGSIVGGNSASYSTNSLSNSDVITCKLTSNAGCGGSTVVTSNSITIIVNQPITPSVSINANPGDTICTGTTAVFTLVAMNGGTSLVYQWKKNGVVVGANSISYSPVSLSNNDVITCKLTCNAICGGTVSVTASKTIRMRSLPIASITVDSYNGLCNKIELTAHSSTTEGSYDWSTNAVSQSIDLLLADPDGVYSVFVTDSKGCTSTKAAKYTYTRQNLLNSYTILGLDEVDLGENNIVQSGSVGVKSSNGDASFKKNSSVAAQGAFVKAKNIAVQNPSNIPYKIYAAANVILPVMQNGSFSFTSSIYYVSPGQTMSLSGNYAVLVIGSGANVTLTGSSFGLITVGADATVTFTSGVLNIGSIGTANGSTQPTTLNFMADCNVKVAGEICLGEKNIVNPAGRNVTFYMNIAGCSPIPEFKIGGRSTTVNANIFMPSGRIEVVGHNTSMCYMNGSFIASEVVSLNKNVTWNGSDCSGQANLKTMIADENEGSVDLQFKVTAMPNPSNRHFLIQLTTPDDIPYTVRIVDVIGRMVETRQAIPANASVIIGEHLNPGNYVAEIIQGNRREIVKLIKVN